MQTRPPHRRDRDRAGSPASPGGSSKEERALAQLTGPVHDADLDDDIEAATRAYVGLAVTEIATLRAELDDPNLG